MRHFYLGLDIGGTYVRIASAGADKRLTDDVTKVKFRRLNTAEEEVNANICELIEALIHERKYDIKRLSGIGISTPALFDRLTGSIVDWPNNRLWNNFPLKEYLSQKYQTKIVLEDDANSAAIGEHLCGAGQDCNYFAYITVGTGIGCGLILDGNLYTGKNGWAGEIGHMRVSNDGPRCKCGKVGCLQSYASGPAILQKGRGIGLKHGVSIRTLGDLAELSGQGVEWCIELFEEAAKRIARMITNLVMVLDIQVIIVGGGVISCGEVVLGPIRNAVLSFLDNMNMNRNVEIRRSLLGDSSGVAGVLSLI